MSSRHARTAQRSGPRRRPARPRHRCRRHASDRVGASQRSLLLLPHRHRVRRRRRQGGRAARLAQALARPPALHLRRAHDVAARVRPPPSAFPVEVSRRPRDRRRFLHDRAQHQPVHVSRQHADRPLAGGDARRPARGGDVPHAARVADPSRAGLGVARAGRAHVGAARPVARRRAHDRRARDAVPVPTRRRLPRRCRAARVRLRARRRAAGVPGVIRLNAQCRADGDADVGDVGADPVDAPSDQPAHAVGVVTCPRVDRQAGHVGAADQRLVDDRVPRVEAGGAPAGSRAGDDVGVDVERLDQPRRARALGRIRRHTATVSKRNEEISHRAPPPRPASGRTRWASHSVGSKSGSAGSFLISMLTNMPAQASSAAARLGMSSASSAAGVSRITRVSIKRAS